MSASLVGSEMCIRDSSLFECGFSPSPSARPKLGGAAASVDVFCVSSGGPVSYTHLTLPTICSV
eukprot:13338027-Alexandrium_andersonii.AAC.1